MNVTETLLRLRQYCEKQDFAGWDPYDALNSPFMPVLSLGTKYGRIAWTQFLRRSPVNLRPLLRIPKGHNPKGLGLFLRSYSKLYAMERKPEYLDICRKLIDLLKKYRSEGFSGNCWGYNFPWQSRVTNAPRFTPTIVNSSFIGHALLDCYELTGIVDALDLAVSIPDFILKDLNRKQEGDTFCFSYMPIDYDYVHNANMLGASLLMRVAKKMNLGDEVIETARRSMAYTMNYQHEDGSWYFGDDLKIQGWIDSYHTGFVLEALRYAIELGAGAQWRGAFQKGKEFYANNFFLPDGTCTYYHDRSLPIDIHCPSEAIIFFAQEHEYSALVDKTCGRMIETLWDERGYFHFRLTGGKIPNRIPYIRWGQAWALLSLVEYEYAKYLSKG